MHSTLRRVDRGRADAYEGEAADDTDAGSAFDRAGIRTRTAVPLLSPAFAESVPPCARMIARIVDKSAFLPFSWIVDEESKRPPSSALVIPPSEVATAISMVGPDICLTKTSRYRCVEDPVDVSFMALSMSSKNTC